MIAKKNWKQCSSFGGQHLRHNVLFWGFSSPVTGAFDSIKYASQTPRLNSCWEQGNVSHLVFTVLWNAPAHGVMQFSKVKLWLWGKSQQRSNLLRESSIYQRRKLGGKVGLHGGGMWMTLTGGGVAPAGCHLRGERWLNQQWGRSPFEVNSCAVLSEPFPFSWCASAWIPTCFVSNVFAAELQEYDWRSTGFNTDKWGRRSICITTISIQSDLQKKRNDWQSVCLCGHEFTGCSQDTSLQIHQTYTEMSIAEVTCLRSGHRLESADRSFQEISIGRRIVLPK